MFSAFDAEMRGAQTVLDVAPAPVVERLIRRRAPGTHVGIDLDPKADDRSVSVVADLCATPFAEDSFDIAVCFHVFEHIPRDTLAMRELARVLRPGGVGFVQVPWRQGSPTDEDWGATPEERIKRFGQADHIRWYGSDFEDRLLASGLDVARVWPRDILPDELCAATAIPNRTPIWIVSPAADSHGRFAGEDDIRTIGSRLQSTLLEGWRTSLVARCNEQVEHWAELDALRAEAKSSRSEAAQWERTYLRLRGRLPVRVMAAVKGLITKER